MTKHRDDILRLRAEGKSYREIQKELGCSSSTVSYHLGAGQKEKAKERKEKSKTLREKIDAFKAPTIEKEFKESPKSHDWKMREKVRRFQMKDRNDTSPILEWTYEELQEKMKDIDSCYLTGRPIDTDDYTTFQLDHIIPRCLGGTNKLENVGVATPQANYAKGAMSLEDFLALCVDVVVHWEIVDKEDIRL